MSRLVAVLLALSAALAATLFGDPVAVAVHPPSVTSSAVPPLTTGWLGWWASDGDIAKLAGNGGAVDEVSMFWWTFDGPNRPLCPYDNGDFDKDGSWGECLESTATPWATPKAIRFATTLEGAGVRVLASVLDNSKAHAGEMGAYLSESGSAYALQIADWAVKAGVDGVNVEFLSFAFRDDTASWPATTRAWQEFIPKLSKELHSRELELAVSVPAGPEPFLPSGLPNPGSGYSVYAWQEIAPYVDELRILTYDYRYPFPGPTGPNDWAEKVAASAVEQVGHANASKIWVGVPQYGRAWPIMKGGSWSLNTDCPSDWKPYSDPSHVTLTPLRAWDKAEQAGVQPMWDAAAAEWTFRYWDPIEGRAGGKLVTCDVEREAWFSDTESAVARAKIVTKYGLGGIAVWDFGTVMDGFYPQMAEVAVQASNPSIDLVAPSTVKAGRSISLSAQFSVNREPQSGRIVTLWWAPNRNGQRIQVTSKITGPSGKVIFRARPGATGVYWATLETTLGFQWTAGPATVRVTR